MIRPTRKVILYSVVIFMAGGVSGAIVTTGVLRHRFRESLRLPPAALAERAADRMTRLLSLDATQRDQVVEVLEPEFAEVRVRRREMVERIRGRVAVYLRDDQKAGFETLGRKMTLFGDSDLHETRPGEGHAGEDKAGAAPKGE